jgi:hypothetical protein
VKTLTPFVFGFLAIAEQNEKQPNLFLQVGLFYVMGMNRLQSKIQIEAVS